jgi:RNA polymerase sigma-70 factor (ECF subfamily)
MKRRVCGNAEPLSPANEPRSLAPGPEQAALDGDRQRLIHTLVDALPEDLRLPLMLSAFEELNSREIGGILSVPEGTVRTRIHRARLMIREKLAAHKASKSEHTVGRGHA